ncbi:MAG: LysM peptidoglycan-binding domain-containing protein [Anaerolineales bacterium]|nr:MAG: LysM peptidoglycan-binding domain-containing protein [Anaerolineales bacterium]
MRIDKELLKKLPLLLMFASLLAVVALSALPSQAAASPLFQSTPQPLPEPGPDGRILYTALPGDSPWLIAGKFNIAIEQLRILNSWGPDKVLQEGETVILGMASDATATAEPTSEVVATTTPEGTPGTGTICVLLFDDVNGDAMRQDAELGIPGGAASVSERTGLASRQGDTLAQIDTTTGLPQAVCFSDLPGGEYTVSVAAPQGFNPTTAQSATIQLTPGDETSLNFGAQAGSSSGFNLLAPEEGGPPSPLMGLLGVVLVIAGGGLGMYSWRLSRRRF